MTDTTKNLKPFKHGVDERRGVKPKGAIHLSTRIQNMMNDDQFTTELVQKDGKRIAFKGNPAEAIIKTAVLKAMSGDKQWADWLAQNGYGQKLEISVLDPAKELLKKYDLIDNDGNIIEDGDAREIDSP